MEFKNLYYQRGYYYSDPVFINLCYERTLDTTRKTIIPMLVDKGEPCKRDIYLYIRTKLQNPLNKDFIYVGETKFRRKDLRDTSEVVIDSSAPVAKLQYSKYPNIHERRVIKLGEKRYKPKDIPLRYRRFGGKMMDIML